MRWCWYLATLIVLTACSPTPSGPEATTPTPISAQPTPGTFTNTPEAPSVTPPITAPATTSAQPTPDAAISAVIVTMTPAPLPADGPVEPSGSAPPQPQGANAAPDAGFFDASTAASSTYRAWLVYEMNSDGDLGRGFETEAYPDGAFVCGQLALGTPTGIIENTLSGAKGWSGTGAAAIIKGAVSALCPRYNQGYTTYFDRTVSSASAALGNALPWTNGVPPFYEVGYFMKEACGYLQKVGSAQGLEDHLHTFRRGGPSENIVAGMFIQRVLDDQLLRRATHHAVFAGCLGDHLKLNLHWTGA